MPSDEPGTAAAACMSVQLRFLVHCHAILSGAAPALQVNASSTEALALYVEMLRCCVRFPSFAAQLAAGGILELMAADLTVAPSSQSGHSEDEQVCLQ